MTIGLIIAGDPKRRNLSSHLSDIYQSYSHIKEVYCYYEKNPAIAFNRGAHRLETDILVGIGGDVLIGETELERLIRWPGDVIFATRLLYPRYRKPYPAPWSQDKDARFIDGAFRLNRYLLIDYPMPESPSFLEDELWYRKVQHLNLVFVGIQVPGSHIDIHSLFRPFRTIHHALSGKVGFDNILKHPFWAINDYLVGKDVFHNPRR